MTKFDVIRSHTERDIRCRAEMEFKSDSYSWGPDPFKNFRKYGLTGILVRMNDKIERLESIVASGRIKDGMCGESIEETCRDLINYTHIFADYAAEIIDTLTLAAQDEATDDETD